MIIDECKDARELLERVQDTTQNRSLVDTLQERINDLRTVLENVTTSASKLDVLRQKDEMPSDNLPDGQVAIDRAIKMKEILAENPGDVTEGTNFTELKRSFETLTGQIDEVTKEAWDKFVNRCQPKLDKSQLEQAGQTGHLETVKKIEDLMKEVKGLTRRPPVDKPGLAAIEKLWEQVRACVKRLPARSEDPEIQEFLDAAYNAGARLEQLTPAVEKWLREQDMLEKFSIFTGATR